MISQFIDNVWWDENSKINGKYAVVKSFKTICTASKEWFNTTYHVWTHPFSNSSDNEKVFVCIHGLARNAHDFDYIAQRIISTIPNSKVVCIDMPGRGTSEWMKSGEYTYPVYINVVCSVLASLGSPRDIYWIGTSMGGLIGMSMFALDNCPIKKMVLVDIGPFVSSEALKRISAYVKQRPSFDTFEEFESYIQSLYKQFGNLSNEDWKFMAKMLVKVENENGKENYTFHYDPRIIPDYKPEDIKDLDLWHIWDKVNIEVLLLRGKFSDVLLKDTADQMVKKGSYIKMIEFDDCGHTPHLFTEEKCEPILKFFMSN